MWDEITDTNGYVWSPNIYYACENLSMLGLKLIQVSKNAPPPIPTPNPPVTLTCAF